jgi:hypothetical protein
MRVPAGQAQRDEAHTRFHQPPGHQGPLPEAGHAVALAHSNRFAVQLQRLAGLVGAEDVHRLLVELVEAVSQARRLVEGRQPAVEPLQQLRAVLQLIQGESGGQDGAS